MGLVVGLGAASFDRIIYGLQYAERYPDTDYIQGKPQRPVE